MTLLANLRKAIKVIETHAGSKHVPIGYYPFQDACPKYQHGTAEPPFETIAEAGFKYMITYKHENQFPEIVFSNGDFLALNQQVEHWSFNPLQDLQAWEKKMIEAKRAGWIIVGLDAPFWGMVPCYFGIVFKGMSLYHLQKVMTYARDGGESGRLFMVKPHEVSRIAKIMRDQGSIE